MPDYIFAFGVWIVAITGIVINTICKDRLGRILALITFFLAVVITVGILMM